MAKLSEARLAALRAAKAGRLLHSVYGGYDWATGADGWSTGRCTRQAQALVRDGLVVLCPRQRGDEHRGQPYELTDGGRAELDRDQIDEEGWP